MFTGLIEEVGQIAQVEAFSGGSRLTVAAQAVLDGARLGDSIAVDGACTTVIHLADGAFVMEASPETLSRTTFNQYTAGTRVNLERPLLPTSRLGGHYVTGHVDGLGRIISVREVGLSWVYRIRLENPALALLVVEKGSIAVNGVSLTVNQVEDADFTVAIIPYTRDHTNLADYHIGDRVNIETDLLGKYVQRLMPPTGHSVTPMADEAPPTPETPATPAPTRGHIRSGPWFNFDDDSILPPE